jgi:hypothetical protein
MSDEEILDIVDSMSDAGLLYYSNCFLMVDLKHYMRIQSEWFLKEKYYLGVKLRKNPTEIETLNAWEEHRNSERFKAFYVIKFPDRIKSLEPEYYI